MTFHLPDTLMFSFQAAEITDISGKKCNAKHRKDVCIIQHKTFVCPGSETYLSAMLHAQEFMILNTLHFCIHKIYKLTKPRYIDLSSRETFSLTPPGYAPGAYHNDKGRFTKSPLVMTNSSLYL